MGRVGKLRLMHGTVLFSCHAIGGGVFGIFNSSLLLCSLNWGSCQIIVQGSDSSSLVHNVALVLVVFLFALLVGQH